MGAEQVPLFNFFMPNQANQHIPCLDLELINKLSNSMQQSFFDSLQKQQQAKMENQLRDLLHFFFYEKNMASDRTVCVILNDFIRICNLNSFFLLFLLSWILEDNIATSMAIWFITRNSMLFPVVDT